MMKTTTILLVVCIASFVLYSCQTKTDSYIPLFENFDLKSKKVKSLDDLFGKKAKYISLETSADESLIGKINKIIKRKESFFILSDDKRILQFDSNGKFVTVLDKQGNGPEEYTMINDFNLYVNNENEIEIWINDFSKLRKYKYANSSWTEFAKLEYPYVVNKFHIINKNKLLLLTGQNANCLTVSDGVGNEITTFMESKIPFLVFKPVQFINFSDDIIFQKGVSNGCVVFSTLDNTFKEQEIISQSSFLTSNQLLDLFETYEYDYLRELSNYSYIRTLRDIQKCTLIEFFMNGHRYVSVSTKHEGWKHLSYDPQSIQENKDLSCLSTIGIGDSADSFVMFKTNDNEDCNPIIIEYY